MLTADECRALRGREVTLSLRDGSQVAGHVVGTLEAADGLVVIVDRSDRPGARFTCNYQEIEAYQLA